MMTNIKLIREKKFPFLTRNIIVLSLVSFFTDIASEMLYPIMPIYLASIGYGAITVGIIEGFAESIAGLNKVFFGHLSDKLGKRNLLFDLATDFLLFQNPLSDFPNLQGFIFSFGFLIELGKAFSFAS